MFSISRFQRLMQGLPQGGFERIVQSCEGDKHVKGFSCRNLLVAQVYGQLSGSRSLREIEAGYNAHASQHYHLGTGPLKRTTLSDASARRNPAVFEATARLLMGQASRAVRRQSQAGLLLLDSTSFTLKGRGFDEWTQANRTRNTQGVKLHLVYDPDQAVPVVEGITAANINDVTWATTLPLRRGATYVFDKGYCDYNWWARFNDHQAHFITRLKINAKIEVLRVEPIPEQATGVILADERIILSNKNPGAGRKNLYTEPLRRVVVARPDHDTPLVLVTNDFDRSAQAIADSYRARWQIELFFKWIKQNLRIKQFYGRSENAVRIQILCALIAYLLTALYHAASQAGVSLRRTLDTLRIGMFQRPSTDTALAQRRRNRLREQLAVQPGLFT